MCLLLASDIKFCNILDLLAQMCYNINIFFGGELKWQFLIKLKNLLLIS